MIDFVFKTKATMKPYNCKNWWIDAGIISPKRIAANNLNEALETYASRVQNEEYISISKSAIKRKTAMYIDTVNGVKQTGYVITAKDYFEDRYSNKSCYQYIDLWIEIYKIDQNIFGGGFT